MTSTNLTVLKINSADRDIFLRDTFSLENQQTLNEHNFSVNKLGLPQTKVIKLHEEGDFIHYKVRMSTDTIKEPIFIFEKGCQEWNKGYQKIEEFEFWIEKDFSKLYVFAHRLITNQFLRRLKRANYISTSKVKFDFSKIGGLENMESAWGLWQDSTGVERRIARFGKGINTIITDYSPVTTFYIDYSYGAEIVQLILSIDGRVSTNHDLTKRDMIVVYRELAKILS